MIYMRSMGATEISESTRKHFRRKLEKDFGDLLQFEDLLNNNKPFVLPKNLSKVQLARDVVAVSQQLDNKATPSKVKKIQQIDLLIRDAVILSNTEMSWPPKPFELCENAVNLPSEIEAFSWQSPNCKHRNHNGILHRVRRLVNSFGQDIIYGVTGGRQKLPKKILLLYAEKKLWQTLLNFFRC